jgi:hypothetical protein
MALNDKHIKPEEVEIDSLMKKAKAWIYVPRRLPYTKKQIFQNIIWLITNNHAKDKIVKFSVFGDTLSSKLCLNYLNCKSIILGKILGIGVRNSWLSYFMAGIPYISKGDFKTIYFKIRKRIFNKIKKFLP